MRNLVLLLTVFFIINNVEAQLTIIVDSIPSNTPVNADIYIAGDFQGWDPGNPSFKLIHDTSNSIYHIALSLSQGSIKYKFTRGDWTTVEGNELGGFLPDRMLTFSSGDTVYHTVLSWEDLGGTGCSSTAGSTVMIYDTSYYIPQLNKFRRIWVYLPDDYNTSSKHYPVLYMHDGQNLFDQCTSFIGEWEIDESLDALEMLGDSNIIVVGIDNGGVDRLDEYSPWYNAGQNAGGDGEKYIDFIVQTLKLDIDANFRTKPGRDYTGLMGSSMGGLISFYGALRYQDVFSKAGIFSPSFWYAPDSMAIFMSNHPKLFDMKFYFLMGGQEGAGSVNLMLVVADTMSALGFTDEEIKISVPADGQHSEWFWAREFPDAYQWLYLDKQTSIKEINNKGHFVVFPNPANDKVSVSTDLNTESLEIFDIKGERLMKLADRSDLDISYLNQGFYIIRLKTSNNLTYYSKFLKIK